PMPYAVYFTYNGHAFHEGNPNVPSAGCIHLSHDAAVTFFDSLQPGDEVFIY
ncbi:L,D-transpeptidase family protein, partial [Corynebacterium bovis]